MRILLGHTPDGLHPDTTPALMAAIASAPVRSELELADVSGDDYAYWHAIRQRWDGTGDLVIIEQDNVIHDQVIAQFAACPGDWCVFPYPIFNSGQILTQGLGCTRFSAALQRKVPAAEFEADGKLYADDGADGIPWNFLDLVIAGRLRIGHGLTPHVHDPPVAHRHDYGGPVVLGAPEPSGRRRPAGDPLAAYHRQVPIRHDTSVLARTPAVQVYGAAMTDVSSPEDAARLASSLAARYLHGNGRPRDIPAQLDTTRKPPMRFATDKITHGYLPAYLRIAARIGLSGRVCEIGVFGGDSLHMWQSLFPGGIICGVDSDPGARWPAETAVVVCGQDDDDLPARLQAISPAGWDLIVDDASHDGKLSAATFALLWPLVVPGGFYVLEDWMVGIEGTPWHHQYGDSMLETAQSFLTMLDRTDSELESAEYRYGMAILRKRG